MEPADNFYIANNQREEPFILPDAPAKADQNKIIDNFKKKIFEESLPLDEKIALLGKVKVVRSVYKTNTPLITKMGNKLKSLFGVKTNLNYINKLKEVNRSSLEVLAEEAIKNDDAASLKSLLDMGLDPRKVIKSAFAQKKNECLAAFFKDTDLIYIGDSFLGKMHGKGTCYFADGSTYTGQWARNLIQGKGTTVWASGNKYVGEYSNGRRNGTGTSYFKDGHKYEGRFKDDMRHGKGKVTTSNGDVYEGNYVNGKIDGVVTSTENNGDKYIFYYKMDEVQGNIKEDKLQTMLALFPRKGKKDLLIPELIIGLKDIPQDMHLDIIKQIIPIKKKIDNIKDFKLRDLITIYHSFMKSGRLDLFNSVVNDKNYAPEEKKHILNIITLIPENEQVDVAKIRFFVKKAKDNMISYSSLTSLIKLIPPSQRAFLIDIIPSLYSSHNLAILTTLTFFPEDKYEMLLETIANVDLQSLGKESVIARLLKDQSLLKMSHDHISTKLESTTDLEETRYLAKLVYMDLTVFQLFDEHPLAQLALNKLILTETSTKPNNPYNVYKQLQQMATEKIPQIELPVENLEGKNISINLDTFRARANLKPILFGQVPDIDPQFFNNHFSALENRLNGMDKEKKQKLLRQIAEITGRSNEHFENELGLFNLLKDNFVSDLYITRLLAIPKGKPGDEAPGDLAQLSKLIEHISTIPNELPEGQLLSEREVAILMISESIQNCSVGKKGGIAQAYDLLEIEYKYGGAGEQKADQEKAGDYLDQFAQKFMSDNLTAENPIMREMMGDNLLAGNKIKQLVHQSGYVENALSRLIGMNHKLTFDPYTGVLYNSLISKKANELLSIYVKHNPPKVHIEALKKLVNADVNAQPKPRNNAYTLMNSLCAVADTTKFWKYNEETYRTELTDEAAIEILLKIGFFQVKD